MKSNCMVSAVASGILLALAFEFPALSFLSLIAAVPWLLSLRTATPRQAWMSSSLFGVVLYLHQMFWVVPFTLKWTNSITMAILPMAVILALVIPVFAPLGFIIRTCWARNWAWLIPMAWASHEVFRSFLPELAFPWAFLATPLVTTPALVQHASLGTVWFVSASFVAFGLAAAYCIPEVRGTQRNSEVNQVAGLGVAAVACFAFSLIRYALPQSGESKTFLMAQHGIDMAFSDSATKQLGITESAGRALDQMVKEKPDLAVFPEGFSRETAYDEPPYTPLGFRPPTPVIFGSYRQDGEKTYQSAFAFDRKWKHLDKTKIVVFGEYVPFRKVFPILNEYNLTPVDLTAGSKIGLFEFEGMRVAPLICFEGVFPELGVAQSKLGAQVFVQMSIDDWYAGTQAHRQLWQSSVWRSIENGLPLVRVGSQGQSLVTNSRGKVELYLPQKSEQLRTVLVTIPKGSDAFSGRLIFPIFSAIVGVYLLLVGIFSKRLKSQPITA